VFDLTVCVFSMKGNRRLTVGKEGVGHLCVYV
jgi:hypothetical protein